MFRLRLVWPTYDRLHVTCQLVDSPFTVGRGVVVSGRFNQVDYGVAAFICYPHVCVSEYVCNLVYLRGNVRDCCPFLVFAVMWCGVFCFMFYLMS